MIYGRPYCSAIGDDGSSGTRLILFIYCDMYYVSYLKKLAPNPAMGGRPQIHNRLESRQWLFPSEANTV